MSTNWQDLVPPDDPDPGRSSVTPSRPPTPARAGKWVVSSSTRLGASSSGGAMRLVRTVCVLALVWAAFASGLVRDLLTIVMLNLVAALLPLFLLIVLFAMFLPMLAKVFAGLFGAMLHLTTGVVGAGARAGTSRMGRRGGFMAEITSLMCQTPAGTTREVRVSAPCNVPVGAEITVYGPTFMGRKEAWILRNHSQGQTILAPGLFSTAVLALLTVFMVAGTLAG